MPIDFKEQFGVNAGYVETLFDQWRADAAAVDPEWARWFEKSAPAVEPAVKGPVETDEELAEPLRGVAARSAANMEASLEVPTATSVRTLPVKVLDENRRVLNQHMLVRALGKASYTHLVAYALVRAVAERPNVQSRCEDRDGRAFKVTPKHVNLGLAIDVPGPDGARSLVVPSLKASETLSFKQFYDAYQDVVERGRDGELTAADFAGTTVSLTNPGGFGTQLSVPRLMKGQGLIVATGGIGVPTEARYVSPAKLAELAISPVMTVTSTYDHRTVQGAESGLMLKRMEELLDGADGFWDEIFRCMRVPWTPFVAAADTDTEDPGLSAAEKQAKVWLLINAYRVRGCRLADLDPLEYRPDPLPSLDPAWYGFTIWDLDREFLTDGMCGKPVMTLREILEVLRETYCRRWGIEYMHVVNRVRKHWIRERVEPRRNEEVFDQAGRERLLRRLVKAENFERFLHTRYPGNKRFSLEGADTLVPMLGEILDRLAANGVERVVLGMAHRGRLNVLANILNKSYERIFGEFEAVMLPSSVEGSGDVKYHLGQRGRYQTPEGREVEVLLSANPSHLEAVDPVVCGMVRGYQDRDGDALRKKTVGVLIHGDAAFTGQGVVAETLQMSGLRAYRTGGTIHVVVNNQIGFTASPKDLHSTYYCTDIAKMIQAPVLHANGDYPESVLKASHVAVDYHAEFGADVVIDMVCYRRRGHNEGDEPAYTQPLLYQKIATHPTVRENYIDLLVRRGAMTREECEAVSEQYDDELRAALEKSRGGEAAAPAEPAFALRMEDPADWWDGESPETAVAEERLIDLIDRSNGMPDGHVVHPNLLRQLRRREDMVRGGRDLDWGCAETLAFASLLEDGVSIRLAGQDSGRGTFSHRHAVIRDQVTGADHVPLAHLVDGARFEAWDSLLSEEAGLGFEYGYAAARPEAMVLWEAQFGDFVNGAQIPIDQFLAAGESKWGQRVGPTLLLPHGYDGQGPEHSSARPERFLQLCAEGNFVVANCSTAAQYFHLLRRQGGDPARRPLVLFTPKSLLRDPRAASPVGELARGGFREVIGDASVGAAGVRRVVLCTGKVFHDLEAARAESRQADVALLRLEQLYPFPRQALLAELDRHPDAELVWLQEEPKNMGAWTHVRARLLDLDRPIRYLGRPAAASPATGSYRRHQAEQQALVDAALQPGSYVD
ncbi:MAG: multifunctional oxoglutarate decarboxylase/oxoglutarate dehydrogenase thiamine pyrophosphate-binding subunit/dihydrolipoyllysine-residue succinyltransferase subunit [Planctomycetes bacterium]|nr:multifunctional oxoglutarate decarboxylase/oxoglutarate dehydrogenase thiamine pyrophosphate-binding subunit/dihydrolipoyllysine-residue succinyltransferase subunit [Planctomycetota bacterium]